MAGWQQCAAGTGEEEHVPLRYFYHWGTPAVHVSPVLFGAALTCSDDGVQMMEFVRRTRVAGLQEVRSE